MSGVRRVYVEKKRPYAVKARQRLMEIQTFLGIQGIRDLRLFIRYDIEDIRDDVFETACRCVFSEPPVDDLYREKIEIPEGARVFSVEPVPGQFDQRADSAMQCIKLLNPDSNVIIKTAETYILLGEITDEEFIRIKKDTINPVDSREASMEKPETLEDNYPEAPDVQSFDGFINMSDDELKGLYDSLGLAMTFEDFKWIRHYFDGGFDGAEHRDPTMTEIRVLDTYWSDHCRHTTYSTEIKDVTFDDGYYKVPMETTYESYQDTRNELFQDRPDKFPCLMDMALIGMRKLKADGKLTDKEDSHEDNACTVIVPIEVDYGNGPVKEDWLIFFKNETHNHPTEIEPFGGAATCLGGAIRDPLSGRGYVYQAMRVTGAADPTVSVEDTLEGKLPQKKLVTGAAQGYSSYGNQIGLATGEVTEIYHPDYVAKRMEIGAVMGAAARKNVVREDPVPGDVIILLGGRTGRDGMGGATGASKAHTEKSLASCGAEVQKGNAPTERKLQRLFRRPEVAHMIKKCNDFGAGGVSVAIGELADGLVVNMDLVPKKYEGLDGTELAISESQERMAVVVAPENKEQFLSFATEENLEATHVATVTEEPRLVLNWRGKAVVNIERSFLATNGAHQETKVEVEQPSEEDNYFTKIAAKGAATALGDITKDARGEETGDAFAKAFTAELSDLNVCSQRGLVERFDSSIGAGTVTMPYGGKYQLTKTQAMAAKVPVLGGTTDTITMMSYGFDPYLSSWSPYHGAIYAVTESIAKIIASGGGYDKIHFTFQEYFRRMSADPKRWSQPFAALLGAYDAQLGYGIASIGGKDSSSGTFDDKDREINVPPTLVSFAVDIADKTDVLTPELKKEGDLLVRFMIPKDVYDIPVYDDVIDLYRKITGLIRSGIAKAAYALDAYGLAAAAAKMAFGNKFGVKFSEEIPLRELFENAIGDIVVEVSPEDIEDLETMEDVDYDIVGTVTADGESAAFTYGGSSVSMEAALTAWTGKLESVYPTVAVKDTTPVESNLYDVTEYDGVHVCTHKIGQPVVFIPVFPGTNCEYDSAAAFGRAGARPLVKVFRNITPDGIRDSVKEFQEAIRGSQIIMFPGGFSAGDEPDGSAKFFASSFRNESIREAITDLLDNRDGLVLGICNGFQALIKLGLVPNGGLTGQDEEAPTLTFNTIGRHISREAYLRVVSNKSPWLQGAELGGVYVNPASHGEGRFVAPKEWIERLFANGQVATQYCNPEGRVSMDEEWNINGSYAAIEGITSPDGRVLGKMCHSERRGDHVAINIYGEQDLKIFESGVRYFS
ncbi:phosphoribosylformylglycinamidine synthase [Lachnospiraceae bacterium NK3A20]|nr:phosphoribosylformylglycinamidine synthase [Lachnospiraceae bacterium NK3A20]